MTALPRTVWAATMAKLVSPLEPERAAKALSGLVSMLNFPADAFTMASAQEVCSTGRVLDVGVYAPLTRVPTFGELEKALGRCWSKQRERMAVAAAPIARERLPAPENTNSGPSAEALAEVAALAKAFVAERSFNQPAGTVERPHAQPRHLSDGQLLIEYERLAREGVTGAATRVAMLRKKIRAASRQQDTWEMAGAAE